MCVCVGVWCVCVRACVRACVRVRVRVRAYVCVRVCVLDYMYDSILPHSMPMQWRFIREAKRQPNCSVSLCGNAAVGQCETCTASEGIAIECANAAFLYFTYRPLNWQRSIQSSR